MAGKKRRKKGNGWLGLLFFVVFCAAVVSIVYVYCTGYESWVGRFLPNSFVNGVDYSGMTAEEAKAAFEKNSEKWTLTVHEMNDETEEILYTEIGYNLTMEISFEEMINSQDYRFWPLEARKLKEYSTSEGFVYDQELLKEKVLALNCITSPDIKDPVDAKVIRTDNGYEVSPSDDGNRLKEDEVVELALNAVTYGPSEIDLVENDCYLKAEIQTNNKKVQGQYIKLNKVQTTTLELFFEDEAYETLDKSIFLDWLGYSKAKVTIDRDQVTEYVKQLAARYDTLGTTRTFHTHDDDEIYVGGDDMDSYGYVMNQEATVDAICTALLAGESKTVPAVFEEYSLCRYSDNDDIGYTYIEISLSEQHMWYYVDGICQLDTDVVTGTPTEERQTPTGVFAVLEKLKDHTMSGSYGTAFTNYTISFNWDGICIHDSSWRSEYGGEIYLSDGSHGCVNTPLDKVAELFDMVHINTPIVIY